MYKVLLTLVLGLSFLIAQPMLRPDCGEMFCDNPEMMSEDFHMMPPDAPMMEQDMLCKQNPKEMVETIRIYKITEALDLSEDQGVRFFPKLKEIRVAKEEFNQARIKLSKQLQDYLQDPNKFAKEIKSLVSEIEANETKLREKEARIRKEITSILTPEQQAKFMLFQQQFNREMREMVGKAKDIHKNLRQKKEPGKWRIY